MAESIVEIAQDDGVQRELTIKEEYQLWRKNCRFMYEFVSETALTWPSLTIQWLPEYQENDGVIDAKLLLGTHTSGEDTNYLKIASTQIPGKLVCDKKANSRIKITNKFENAFEINRMRYMPQDPGVVATINGEGQVDVYNINDESKKSVSHFEPHSANGYGLAWSTFNKGHLMTASDDHSVVNTNVESKNEVFRTTIHEDIVNDAKWHSLDANMFGTVSDDKHTFIYDARTPTTPILRYYNAESKGINSIAFSPFSQNLVAVGNANSNICLLDIRRLTNSSKNTQGILHTMMGHSDSITSLEFSPHKDGIIASGSQDRRLIIWDLFKIGEEQQQEDAEDGCPELFMMHAGHTGAVSDLSWCPYKEWTIGSVADDNIVHLWEVGKSLLNSDTQLDINDKDLE